MVWIDARPLRGGPAAFAPFSGRAWSLIFGLFASTLFTLFVIPVAYWLLYANKPGHSLPLSAMDTQDALPVAATEVHLARPQVVP